MGIAIALAVAAALVMIGPTSGAVAVQSAPDDTVSVTIPTPPEAELLTDPPQAGQPATVRLTSSDAETGLAGFWYGINEEVRREFVDAPAEPGATGSAEITFTVPASGGRIWIYMWAQNQVGDSSHRSIFDFFVSPVPSEPPTAVAISRWPLSGHTNDVLANNDLELPGSAGIDYRWQEDLFCFPEGSLWLDGSLGAHAHTAGPTIVTGESFSIAAWVRLDALTGDYQTLLSQGALFRQAVQLQVTPDARWQFAVPHRNPLQTMAGVAQTAPGSVEPGIWHHVVGVLDLEQGEVRLYLNGEHAATAPAASASLTAKGPFYVGIGGNAFGVTTHPLYGSLDTLALWSSTLLPRQIRDLGSSGGGWQFPCF